MFRLYCILKDRGEPPTAEEIAVASGKQALDPTSEAEYIKKLEAANENIRKAFAAQAAQAAVHSPHIPLGMHDTVRYRVRGIKKNSSAC